MLKTGVCILLHDYFLHSANEKKVKLWTIQKTLEWSRMAKVEASFAHSQRISRQRKGGKGKSSR
jgi:hypothetical protein